MTDSQQPFREASSQPFPEGSPQPFREASSQPFREADAMPPGSVRPASDVDGHVAAYVAAFATGSSAVMDRLYEPDAVLVPQPGTPLTSAAERRAAYEHLLGFGVPMVAGTRHLYVAGDIALSVVDWSMRGTARQGHPLDLSGVAADVLRRGADGRWRYLINNPFGTGS
ncbi:hypothetical protein Axi01nite_45420 [Actinoplanes xinjiangensis]|nr:hypothetical protein Axi01nite_45420 [Actinoplanes xinjiangensis]